MSFYKINKRISFVLAFVILFSSIFIFPTNVEAAEGVTTVAELQDAVNTATEGEVITLADEFIFGDATLTVQNVNVTVDGGDKVWSSGMLTLNGAGTGSLKVQNLQFGPIEGKRAIEVNATGKVIIENILVEGRTNTSGDGGAFHFAANANLEVRNSTFRNNTHRGSGYSGAAMGTKDFNGKILIENTYFYNNENLVVGSVAGGQGAALYFGNSISATADIQIKNSYFKENKAVENNTSGSYLADGGAICFFNVNNGAKINVEGNTFEGNIAGDDGGAIMLQTNNSVKSGLSFRNNTFYKNIARSMEADDNFATGGAIQFYPNGKFENSIIPLENNTFVLNEAQTGGSGGAIGSSMGARLGLTNIELANNIFLGNIGTDQTMLNIGSVGKVTEISENLGVDNGTATIDTLEGAFGSGAVAYGPNGSSIEAGHESDRAVIPTILIKPGGTADNKTDSGLTTDQRGKTRGTTTLDIGSVEIDSIKYDANGGEFKLKPMPSYTYEGKEYYEVKDGKVTDYYTIGDIGTTTLVVDGAEKLKAENGTKKFKEWNTQADGEGKSYAAGTELTLNNQGLVLYAIWEDGEVEPQLGDVGIRVSRISTGGPLAGVGFELLDSTGKVIESNLVTSRSGLVVVTSVPEGKYYFRMTSVPSGYKVDKIPKEVDCVNNDRTIYYTVL